MEFLPNAHSDLICPISFLISRCLWCVLSWRCGHGWAPRRRPNRIFLQCPPAKPFKITAHSADDRRCALCFRLCCWVYSAPIACAGMRVLWVCFGCLHECNMAVDSGQRRTDDCLCVCCCVARVFPPLRLWVHCFVPAAAFLSSSHSLPVLFLRWRVLCHCLGCVCQTLHCIVCMMLSLRCVSFTLLSVSVSVSVCLCSQTLYSHDGGFHAFKAQIAAQYNSVELKYVKVDLEAKEVCSCVCIMCQTLPVFIVQPAVSCDAQNRSASFLAKNPAGKVPVLETPQGAFLPRPHHATLRHAAAFCCVFCSLSLPLCVVHV